MTVSERLAELGIELPAAPKPAGNYVTAMVVGNVVRTSGTLPLRDGKFVSEGQAGTIAVSLENAQEAAIQCVLNAIAASAEAAGGVDRLASVIKMTGFISSTADFFAQPKVMDVPSKMLEDIFGSKHIRSAVGVAALPGNATVEVELEFALA